MTDDLTTLLRDAGREPTIDLDVDDVHGRGRRRALVRQAGAGIGALALLGVLGAGVMSILEEPDRPVIGEVDDTVQDAAPGPEGRTATAAMSDLGVTVVDVVRSFDGAGGLQARVVTPDGAVADFGTLAGGLPPLGSQVVVTEDLRVWANDVDANLLVGGPDDALGRPALEAQDGVGWAVLGVSEEGLPLVTPAVGQMGDFTGAAPRNVFVLEVDPESDAMQASVRGIPGIDAGPLFEDQTAHAAAAAPEQLALLTSAGESSTVWHYLAGRPDPVALASTSELDRWFNDVVFVEDEVWIAAEVAGATELWIAPTDGGTVRRVATPVGRGEHANEFVVDLQAQVGTDGWVVTLSTAGPQDENGVAWSVDVDAARGASAGGQLGADVTVPVGVYDVLDARGHVHLLPPPGEDTGPLAACADDADAPINAAPSGFGGQVWWVCWDAMAALPEGVAHPYVATELFTGGDGTANEEQLLTMLRAWADGPDAAGLEAGLSGGLDPETATIAGVTVDAGTVTVDLAAGPTVGVLGTTTGGATFVQQVAGIVLQYDAHDTLQFTLDGSCESWGALANSESGIASGCPLYDEMHTPWGQAGRVCDVPRADVNAVPTGDEVAVWRWCTEWGEVLSDVGFVPVATDVGVVRTATPTEQQLGILVAATLDEPAADEKARGLVSGHVAPGTPLEFDVRIDGSTVVVDYGRAMADGLQLSAPFPASVLERAVAAAVFQFEVFDELEFRVDGSCEAYGEYGEGGVGQCIVLTPAAAPWSGSEDPFALGDADPEALVTDGRQLVLLTGIEPELGQLAVNPVVWLTGDEANEAYEARTGDSNGAPNDYYIRDDDPREVSAQANRDDVAVRLVFAGGGCCEPRDASWFELVDYVETRSGGILVWLELVDGTVVMIEEQYTP